MGAATAAQNILVHQAPETHDHVAADAFDRFRSAPREAPQAHRSTQWQHRHPMSEHAGRRLNPKFAAKQVNVMAEGAQALRGPKEISLGTAHEIETLMYKSDFHRNIAVAGHQR